MPRQRIYRAGRQIKTMDRLSRELLAGNYLWFFGRPCHPSWLMSMQFRTLHSLIRHKALRTAVRIKP